MKKTLMIIGLTAVLMGCNESKPGLARNNSKAMVAAPEKECRKQSVLHAIIYGNKSGGDPKCQDPLIRLLNKVKNNKEE